MSEPKSEEAPRGLQIARVAGMPIRIQPSWIFIFALVLWSLSSAYLPSQFPEIGRTTAWIAGLFATLGFFVSLVLHELSHSLVARHHGIGVSGITLFLFGGVSRIEQEPTDPRVELRVAVVGPLTSFALALLFWLAASAARADAGPVTVAVLGYLAYINTALGVFNLIPGLPLDGGRILRAVVWWRTGSLRGATQLASNMGKGVALGLMALGGLEIITGALVGGMWLVFIGLFLRATASAGWEELVMRRALEGLRVEDVMVRDPLVVGPELTLRQLIDEHLVREAVRGYPVCEAGKVLGAISIFELRALPPEALATRHVRDAMVPLDEGLRIDPSDSLLAALRKLAHDRRSMLLVMTGDRLSGIVTRGAVRRVLEIRRLVAGEAHAT
jgi:Zn-dependent protease/CBS domain-containing protein